MATLMPRAPYTPEELQHLYPQNLELLQVQILLRHGERTPVGARFQNTGLKASWPYCKVATSMRSAVMQADGSMDTLQWKRTLETLGKDDVPTRSTFAKGGDTTCQAGELTDTGRATTLALGERIRTLYVEQLGFLPHSLDAGTVQSVALRATPIPRALESVQQAYLGLYPTQTRTTAPTVVMRSMQEETLFPNEGACKRFRELAHAFAARTATLYNDGPELQYVNKKIGRWMPEASPVVKVDSHPRLSGVMDHINASDAHGPDTKLPTEFYDPKLRENVDKICVEEWFIGYMESNEYRKLGIGALVGDLTQRMVERTTATVEALPKMTMAGCHDTTIAATLTALGAMDATKDKWPNFTSNIAFELLKRKEQAPSTGTSGAMWPSPNRTWWSSLFSSPRPSEPVSARRPLAEWTDTGRSSLDGYYVRLRYNDKPMTIPFCKPSNRHYEQDETLCTLAAFKEAADSFTPKNWKAECGMNLGQSAMQPMIERPPGL